ncbi:hypothetical protein ACF3DV_14500 [Chlorogloeopsis fritschii PCC 9212]|uniref:Uncharacterized protein n=1 Tax=Chlorogloeopsis fritschii PCC 6912 TaxID=211165 RepID=A0A3S1A5H3_CHLFR|nr:hypothetical protein [Chlorogloeopsis fritschii]RUR86628.1 hypothetical protein PCC6912_00710 [Chlorogloeopsis fritschii PCC 6912]
MIYSPTIITREELPSIAKVLEEFLRKIRECELKLNSPEIQNQFEKETDVAKKRKFLDERTDLSILRVKLETAILEKIAARLKCLEQDLKEGIEGLNQAINDVENTVNILTTIKNVTGIIARILVI